MKSIEDIKALIKRDYERKVKRFLLMESCEYVIVGDSMIDYFKPTKPWCMQGIAGDTTVGVLNRLHAIKHVNPKRAIIHVGTNDLVLTDLTLEETLNHMKVIKHELDTIEVLFCTPMPVDESAMSENNRLRTNDKLMTLRNMMLEAFDKKHIIDIYPLFYQDGLPTSLHVGDGLHLNKEGYQRFEHVLIPYMSGDSI
jgi:lysophospholipase L1-like esterase